MISKEKKQQKKWRENSNRKKKTAKHIGSYLTIRGRARYHTTTHPSQSFATNSTTTKLRTKNLNPPEETFKTKEQLKNTLKKLKEKDGILECMRKRIKRLEENRSRGNQAQNRRKTVVLTNKRKRMRALLEAYLHRDDVTTIINGKLRKSGKVVKYIGRYTSQTQWTIYIKGFLQRTQH